MNRTPNQPIDNARRLVVSLLVVLTVGAASGAQGGADFVAARPAERVEYWQNRQAEIDATLRNSPDLSAVKLVFVGDSITDFWLLDDDPWVKGQRHGRKLWNESFAGSPPENLALNLGISGDRTEHVLFRLSPRSAGGLGELDAPALNPEFFVVMIGINNTWAAEEPVVDSVFEGVRAVLAALRERRPRARIILQSLLPTQDVAKNRAVVRAINQRIAALAQTPAFAGITSYLDLYPAFVNSSGQQIASYFVSDGLHPSEAGYRVWRDRLVPFLAKIRAAAPPDAAR